jgi:hypothetical protein
MRKISNLKLQITNKLQKVNYKYLVVEICDLPSNNIKMLTTWKLLKFQASKHKYQTNDRNSKQIK